MKSVDVIVEQEEGWTQGFRVSRGVDLGSKEPRVYVSDFARGSSGETCTRIRGMDPDTARRVAVELAAMADALEAETSERRRALGTEHAGTPELGAQVTPKRLKAKLPDAPHELLMVHDGHGIVEGGGLYGDLEHATVEANQRASDTEHRWYVARYTLANRMMYVAVPSNSTGEESQ